MSNWKQICVRDWSLVWALN